MCNVSLEGGRAGRQGGERGCVVWGAGEIQQLPPTLTLTTTPT